MQTPSERPEKERISVLSGTGTLIAIGVLIAGLAIYLFAPNAPQMVERFVFDLS